MTPFRRNDPRDRSDLLDTIRAADVMQTQLVTVHAGDPIHEVERVLADAQVSGVPVLDDNDHVIGVISTTDLVHRAADADDSEAAGDRGAIDDVDETEVAAYRRAVAGQPCAGDLMTADVASVPRHATLRQMAGVMVEKPVHRLLVLDQGRLVGLVSTMDLLRAIAQ